MMRAWAAISRHRFDDFHERRSTDIDRITLTRRPAFALSYLLGSPVSHQTRRWPHIASKMFQLGRQQWAMTMPSCRFHAEWHGNASFEGRRVND